jgi:hypothetical protein
LKRERQFTYIILGDCLSIFIQVLHLLFKTALYPNPTSDFIQLNNSQPMQIQMLDISGKVVMQTYIQPNARISVEALSNGMYFISTEKGECIKFIKK